MEMEKTITVPELEKKIDQFTKGIKELIHAKSTLDYAKIVLPPTQEMMISVLTAQIGFLILRYREIVGMAQLERDVYPQEVPDGSEK